MRRFLLFLAAFAFAASAVSAGGNGEAAPTVSVREGFEQATVAGVDVQWRVEGDELTVQMTAATTGWVAVGFDPSRMMRDANIIIGYVADGEVMISDDYGTGNTSHGHDVDNGGTNDILSAEGTEENGSTQITFTIPLDSGDSWDKPLAPGNSYTVVVSHGPDGADNFGEYHADRGSFEMEL
jgi:hypothetical protein